jgi:hypothetical protein
VVAETSLSDPTAGEDTLGNWEIISLGEETLEDGIFGLIWTVPGLGNATFQIDEDEYLWAIFDGDMISGTRTVNLTIHADD